VFGPRQNAACETASVTTPLRTVAVCDPYVTPYVVRAMESPTWTQALTFLARTVYVVVARDRIELSTLRFSDFPGGASGGTVQSTRSASVGVKRTTT